jgi:hypothetical protein
MTTAPEFIAKYKKRVEDNKEDESLCVEVPQGFDHYGDTKTSITLVCWTLELPIDGFSQGKSLQYDGRGYDGKRRLAWRIPFLLDPQIDVANVTVSHLCHNTNCYNWNHHTLESLDINKARNGCPGGSRCFHTPTCLRPGPFYKS